MKQKKIEPRRRRGLQVLSLSKEYADLSDKASFTTIDATKEIHVQQSEVRKIISKKIDLPAFRGHTAK